MERTTNPCPRGAGTTMCLCPTTYSRCAGHTAWPEYPHDPKEMFCDTHMVVPVVNGSRICQECAV